MTSGNIEIIGDFVDPESVDVEGALSFNIRAEHIERRKLWESKNLTAEFLGDFWKTMLDLDGIQPTLHFICSELLENAVIHSIRADYMIMIRLCFKCDELFVYVENVQETDKIPAFQDFVRTLLGAENLEKLFVLRIKEARKTRHKKSQVGLITLLKDRGALLSWKFEKKKAHTMVTTLARVPLGKDGQ